MEMPFVTLIADRKADWDGADADTRCPLLHIEFREDSYDATCLAVQAIVERMPNIFAGDPVRVQFVHARPEYSATWDGIMPSRYEVDDRAVDREGAAWTWRDFERDVYRGTRP